MKTNRFLSLLSISFLLLLGIFTAIGCYNSDDVNYKLIIHYMTDGSVPRTLTVEVEKDTRLLGNPNIWGDGSWKYNMTTSDYGYMGNDNLIHYFSAFKNGYYGFRSALSGEVWDTSQLVTRDMILVPEYMDTPSTETEYYNVDVVYYKENKSTQGNVSVYSSPIKCTQSFRIPKRQDGKARLDIQNMLQTIVLTSENPLQLDVEVGYGYVDWQDNGKRYCFYPFTSTTEPSLVDENGNVYHNMDEIEGDMLLYFNYQDNAGYASMNDVFCVTDTEGQDSFFEMEMVFVPGTVDENGVNHPWPNSRQSYSPNHGPVSMITMDANTNLNDYSDNRPVSDMMVADILFTQEDVLKVMNDVEFNRMFMFYNPDDAVDSDYRKAFDTGVQFGDSSYWTYVNAANCCIMANMLTYLYNKANKNTKGFVPLSYVYYNHDGTVFTSQVGMTNYEFPEVRRQNNGFRILSSDEWEYCAKIVADERQLPDLTNKSVEGIETFYHQKGDVTGYRHYFRNVNEGNWSIYKRNNTSKLHYSGSGAALAYAYLNPATKLLTYDKQVLRTGAQAIGRNINTDPRVSSYTSIPPRTDSSGAFDYNTRNAAGLYNMTGMSWQITDTHYGDQNIHVFLRGGKYGDSMGIYPYALRIGQPSGVGVLNKNLDRACRFCRTLSK